MHLVGIDKETSAGGTLSIYAIGDTHLDLRTSDHARLESFVALIARDPQAIAVFVGDLLDGRVPGRKHFDADAVRLDFLGNLKSYVNYGLEVAEHLFKPLIKAKVPLICVSGNHDEYLEEIGLTAEFVRRLGGSARYLGGEGMIRVIANSPKRLRRDNGGHCVRIYATHGTGGGKRPGSKINNMQQYLEWVEADVLIAGHVHDGAIRIIPSYTVRERGTLELVKRDRVMYRAPGFVERSISGVVTYAGRKGFPSADQGLQWVKYRPSERRATRQEAEF